MALNSIITVNQLSINRSNKSLLDNISFAVEKAQFFAILGPNGAGKTTLINALSCENLHYEGDICIHDKSISDFTFADLAKVRAVLPQKSQMSFPMSVNDIVSLGRQPYQNSIERKYDKEVIDACIAQMELSHCQFRYYDKLSGGEQQRVHIARTFAQIFSRKSPASLENKVLILDEPTNHLDISHQYIYMDFLKECQKQGLTIVAVLHDISLALQYADTLLLLDNGNDCGHYTPEHIIKNKTLDSIYNLNIKSYWNEDLNRYLLAPSCKNAGQCPWSALHWQS